VQVLQFSPNWASHLPFPQHSPQSMGQVWQFSVPLHLASPHTGATLQFPQAKVVTSWAHRLSQAVMQQ